MDSRFRGNDKLYPIVLMKKKWNFLYAQVKITTVNNAGEKSGRIR